MKRMRKMYLLIFVLCILISFPSIANDQVWENAIGPYNQSVLLDVTETHSKDSVYQYGRGEYLAEGSVEIVNQGNGDIYLCIDTYAYVNVDRILHRIFLDYWDVEENDWMQVGYWEFEETNENADGQLYELTTTMTLSGYETGLYYRVRGLHGVEYHDEFEACATESDGVLITD